MGLVLQELDLVIHYVPGRKNKKADALSRHPLKADTTEIGLPIVVTATSHVTAASGLTSQDSELLANDTSLEDQQSADSDLAEVIAYLKDGILPEDSRRAHQLTVNKPGYALVEDVLYCVAPDGSLRVLIPKLAREKLFKDAHEGKFGGHLGDTKIYEELSKHYWWPHICLLYTSDAADE